MHALSSYKTLGAALLNLGLQASLSFAAAPVTSPSACQVLWYDSPAGSWESEALPIGNGRLGAMLFGAAEKESVQLNEDSLWEGDEKDTGMYQNLGEFEVALPQAKPVTNYRRELDISRAVHAVTYTSDGVAFRREAFASFPDQVMVFRYTADRPGRHSGSLTLKDGHHAMPVIDPSRLTATGKLKNGLQYESQIRVLNEGGTLSATPSGIAFQNVTSLTLIVGAGTDYLNQRAKGWRTGEAPHRLVTEQLDKAAKRPYAALLEAHMKDYQALFNRVVLDTGKTDAAIAALPTSKRLGSYQQAKANDPELEVLLYQHARYLMISSSRNRLPANLQGLWNHSNNPPWRCDYHTDVNVQMNYWFVDQANLSECFSPLAEWLHSVIPVRRDDTKKEFGTKRGWMTRSENGIFGGASYIWVPGDAAWVVQNIWDHYAFTLDKEYLRTRAYPIIKELCEFWEDSLKEGPGGKLISPESVSPEHGPKAQGNSYEQQLVYDLFTNYIEASKALDVDAEYRKTIELLRGRLLGPQIGKWGQLQEWMADLDDPKEEHRHLSHLIAVHPGRQISPLTTPKFAEAAKVSMNARGDGATGWSRAWKICIWARLQDGNRTHKILNGMLKSQIMPNLFDTHPPFQIDGNFGYAAGVCEMLIQSHSGFIHLLPALPDAWPTGSVKGLRARGGFEVDMAWADGKLTSLIVHSLTGKSCQLRYGGKTVDLTMKPGSVIRLRGDLSRD
ncbi:MAG: glycoside hydrolase family 95 protein [Verrucomicrobiota bacterium]